MTTSQLNGYDSCAMCRHIERTLESVNTHVIAIRSDLGTITGTVHQIDKRVQRLEKRSDRDPPKIGDLLPLLWGLLALALAAAGKIPWSSVVLHG